MVKLKQVRSSLQTLPNAIGFADRQEAERSRNRQRDATNAWRSWYRTQQWRMLRERILVRDGYTCQQTGVLVIGRYPAPNSPVVDHIRPHRGDPELFWNESNLQTVSKAWHDSTKQRIERRQGRGGRIAG